MSALIRFFAIRGPAKQIRSDCGTDFVGACRELQLEEPNRSLESVQKYLQENTCTWVFNPPHTSHMGVAWEWMIGIARHILGAMLLEHKSHLIQEVLTTLMAEVTAIMNARPLIPVSSDPESPLILTRTMLLAQRTGAATPPPGTFGSKSLLKEEWKQVQSLAEIFWCRWRREYLSTLQIRHRWQDKRPSLKEGDIVMLKDDQAKRNVWPMTIVARALPSRDGLVGKVEVKVVKEGTPSHL